MKNMQEYFNDLYEQDFDKAVEVENMVWDLYRNDEEKFDEWCDQNNVDAYDVIELMDGTNEYSVTLWSWDMED
jgi:hypothetical protein